MRHFYLRALIVQRSCANYENAPTHAWVLMPSAAVKFLFRVVACDGYDPVVSRVRRL
jgi:hypothetical protein